jgi:hypothetical protein
VLDDRPEGRAAFRGEPSLTVTGALPYQACDDKVCFNPFTVPLSRTLSLTSPGQQRDQAVRRSGQVVSFRSPPNQKCS